LSWAKALVAMPTFPSWLQAFTAMAAIVISVLALVRGSAAERRRERLQRQGIAVAVYPEILKLEVLIRNAREGLDRLRSNPHHLVGQSVAHELTQVAKISLPPMLERNIDKLFMLGGLAGVGCLQLVNVIWQYNALADELGARVAMMNATQWPVAIGHLEQHLNLLDAVVAKCAHEVGAIHGDVKG
jgi:hypothetical protein